MNGNALEKYLLDGLRLELIDYQPLEPSYPNAWCHILDIMLSQSNEYLSYACLCKELLSIEVNDLPEELQVQLWITCNSSEDSFQFAISGSDRISIKDLPYCYLEDIIDGLWGKFLYQDSYDLDIEVAKGVKKNKESPISLKKIIELELF
jgi:hypothetical protein